MEELKKQCKNQIALPLERESLENRGLLAERIVVLLERESRVLKEMHKKT